MGRDSGQSKSDKVGAALPNTELACFFWQALNMTICSRNALSTELREGKKWKIASLCYFSRIVIDFDPGIWVFQLKAQFLFT